MPGPIPQREDALARPRHRKGKEQVPVTRGISIPASAPRADSDWHPIAKRLWDATKKSGQAQFYQASDWAVLYTLCDDLSTYKKKDYRSAQMLGVIMQHLASLLLTEGDRRRVRVELQEPEKETVKAELVAIADYKRDLQMDDDEEDDDDEPTSG